MNTETVLALMAFTGFCGYFTWSIHKRLQTLSVLCNLSAAQAELNQHSGQHTEQPRQTEPAYSRAA